jgi:hypothetical protein
MGVAVDNLLPGLGFEPIASPAPRREAGSAGERPNAAGRRPVGEFHATNVLALPLHHNVFIRAGLVATGKRPI